MAERRERLVLVPGLGADHRLFAPQRAVFERLEVPPWLEPKGQESLADYGRRMAATIDGDEPFYLGGVSFGGMLALEVARHVKPRAVFLIASCRSAQSFPGYYGTMAWAARFAPPPLMKWMFINSPSMLDVLGELNGQQRQLMLAMLADASPRFVQWGAEAIVNWSSEENGSPIHHIHGDSDRVLPVRLVRPDRVVRGGGHLLNLTHAQEVNQFLMEAMS